VPRVSGQSADGLLLKAVSVIGSGAKAMKYFLFGPEYLFPGETSAAVQFLIVNIIASFVVCQID
jgi:hypothetical protein